MHSLTRPSRWAGLGFALALVASACGSQASPIEASSSAGGSADEPATVDGATGDAEGPSPATEEDEQASAPVPTDHLFPDLDTVNIADGSSLNLAAELAGGDTPVMLWFWAPH